MCKYIFITIFNMIFCILGSWWNVLSVDKCSLSRQMFRDVVTSLLVIVGKNRHHTINLAFYRFLNLIQNTGRLVYRKNTIIILFVILQLSLPLNDSIAPNVPFNDSVAPNVPLNDSVAPNIPPNNSVAPNVPLNDLVPPNVPLNNSVPPNVTLNDSVPPNVIFS